MNYQENLFRQRSGFECNPAIYYVAALAIAAVSTGYQIDAQNKNASAQEAYQGAATASSNKSARSQQEAVREGQAQDTESTARTVEQARLTNQKAESNAVTAIGETGGASNTADALLNEYNMQLGQYKEAVRRQGDLNRSQTEARIEAIGLGATNQALNINRPIDLPNYAAAGVSFAGQALGAYHTYRQDVANTKTGTTQKTV